MPRALPNVSLETPNQTVDRAWDQAVRDLEALRLEDPTFERGVFIPAAGVPWFVTLFGRDSLIVSMQGISGYPEFADRRPAPPLGAAGDGRRPGAGHGARQDPARDPPRRAGPARDPAVPAVLRHARRDEPLRDRPVLPLPLDWATSASSRRYLPNAEAAMAWIDTLRRP